MSGRLGFLMEDCCNGAREICALLSDIVAKAADREEACLTEVKTV